MKARSYTTLRSIKSKNSPYLDEDRKHVDIKIGRVSAKGSYQLLYLMVLKVLKIKNIWDGNIISNRKI